jgi:hypothetical protein
LPSATWMLSHPPGNNISYRKQQRLTAEELHIRIQGS